MLQGKVFETQSDQTRVEKWPECCNEMRFNNKLYNQRTFLVVCCTLNDSLLLVKH